MASQILILSFGKATKEYRPLMDHWIKMIKLQISEKELVCKKPLLPGPLKAEEADLVRQHCLKNSLLILLDPTGNHYSSEKFAKIIGKALDSSKNITFVIGGAYGLDKSLAEDADILLSLSEMTMPHLLAKLVLIEQIYRAQTIIDSHPYHK